ncbi:MAG: arsenate reductase/protein-tyrosine-phosphatase family protein [Promethearchaeota archaeon]|jgi:protein-tyrosine-phosphatase
MAKIKRVLFYCAGNTCRSPFAEAYAKWLQETRYKKELEDVVFDSAGIYHYYETAQPGTINYLKSMGISIINFKTKLLNPELLEKQDLLLGFEIKHHINKINRKFKDIKNLEVKNHLLLEYAGETDDLEIKDPYRLDAGEYNKILKRIEEGVNKIILKIIKINKTEE